MDHKKSIGIGVGCIITNTKNQVLLFKRLNTFGANTWAHPGGHLEFGETFEECAIREVFEEVGLTISNPQFYAITNDIYQENNHGITIFMHAQFPEEQTIVNKEPHKCADIQWFDIEDLPQPLFYPCHLLATKKGYGYPTLKLDYGFKKPPL